MKLIISRLDYIDIREIWQHEAADFTTWLAANIDYLNDKLGFAINVLETEKQIGSFNVDIYCEDEQLVSPSISMCMGFIRLVKLCTTGDWVPGCGVGLRKGLFSSVLIADSNVPARRISTVFLLLFLSFIKRQCYNKGQI